MEYSWAPELDAFREEVRGFVKQFATEELAEELRNRDPEEIGKHGPAMSKVHKELDSRGWPRQAWPAEYGGQGKSPWYQMILTEELAYGGIPFGDLSIGSIAPALMNFGSEDQKKKYLPGIMDGKVTFAIGYSEPNAGTDLASLQTRAVRDGDEWVVNGQKIWTTGAHSSTHVWLAARTDPEAPKHRGISMFIVPLDRDGITVRPIFTMGGTRTNEVFFEDVRVPHEDLIGEENRGWYTVANALDHERVSLAPIGGRGAEFNRLLEHLQKKDPAKLQNPLTRERIADLKIDIHIQRAIKLSNAAIIAHGGTPTMEASMVKVWGSELGYRLSETKMNIFGRYGALRREAGDIAPFHGSLPASYLSSPVLRFGGGTNEVQRNIIAQRGLGLPR